MTIKEKFERENRPKPTNDCHRFSKKNSGGRFMVKTPETRFEALMNAPEPFKSKPIRPPLKSPDKGEV